MNRALHRAWAAVAAGALVTALAPAAQAADRLPTVVDVRLEAPAQPALPHAVVVHLTTSDGAAVTGVQVGVYIQVTFFGGRSALLGRAVTDTSGSARVAITPDRAAYRIRAVFSGNDALAPSETVKGFTIPPGEIHATTEAGRSPLLVGVRRVAPRLVAGLVAVLWVILAAGALWVLRRVHHHGAGQPVAEQGG